MEAGAQIACIGQEEACIPIKFAALHKHLSEVSVGLLGKSLDFKKMGYGRWLT